MMINEIHVRELEEAINEDLNEILSLATDAMIAGDAFDYPLWWVETLDNLMDECETLIQSGREYDSLVALETRI